MLCAAAKADTPLRMVAVLVGDEHAVDVARREAQRAPAAARCR